MGTISKIQWTNATYEPVLGCTRVSEGCRACYAEELVARRMGQNPMTPRYHGLAVINASGQPRWTGKVVPQPDHLGLPLHWKKPRRVFVCSRSDLFHPKVKFEYIAAVFGVMSACPQHTFLVLTKRPERARDFFRWLTAHGSRRGETARYSAWSHATNYVDTENDHYRGPWPLPNVHLGVSVENQEYADERIPILLECPAVLHWVSAEPLLGPLDLRAWLPQKGESNAADHERERCLPRGGDGRLGDRSRGKGLAGACASREPLGHRDDHSHLSAQASGAWNREARVPARASDVQAHPSARAGTPSRLATLQRSDPGRDDNQSQERQQAGQPARESRTSNVLRTGSARAANSEARTPRPERDEECDGETYARTGRRDQAPTQEWRAVEVDRVDVRGFGPSDLEDCPRRALGHVIVGGESTHIKKNPARPCNVQWIRSIVQQCKDANVACFVKQLGSNAFLEEVVTSGPYPDVSRRTWKGKGDDRALFPKDLQVFEYPEERR